MCSSLFLFSYVLLLIFCVSVPCLCSIYPNFTASHLEYIDNNGAFLFSPTRKFMASLSYPGSEITSCYFSVIHVPSNTIVWTANRNNPVSNSGKFFLTVTGITIAESGNSISKVWSTPPLDSRVSVLQLLDSGNLVLLDGNNIFLWESFGNPTDTILMGQKLSVGRALIGAVAADNLTPGDYRFSVDGNDAGLQWNGMSYWSLSTHMMAYKVSNYQVSFLAINSSRLYLLSNDGLIVYQVKLANSDFRVAKLEPNGQFTVRSIVNDQLMPAEFVSLTDVCRIPFVCGKLGMCFNGTCSCPPDFRSSSLFSSSCVPINNSLSLPSVCNRSETGPGFESSVRYMKLSDGIDYFSNEFVEPTKSGASLSVCQDLCSQNCSCLGLFYENASGSCYLVENHFGSVMLSFANQAERFGYIKAIAAAGVAKIDEKNRKFPLAGWVLIPLSGVFLLVLTGFLWWKRKRLSGKNTMRVGSKSSFSEELDMIIPGLPVKFDYEELAVATENFQTEIGSGGFGVVFKGTLPDSTIVAVKKIKNLGINGKREFFSEMAIIGSIHHVNLVRLKGFSMFGSQRFLVYEYMNRGSLADALFRSGPVLTWRERFETAVGIAQGLAYLHNGCAHKIIHCDIKPENILLHEHLQVKISDFGLSKLLSPEQSNRVTTLRGTRGYLAPEWLTSSTISDKSDVYSYGMVLLEILTGRRNCSLLTGKSLTSSEGSESGFVFFPLVALQMHKQKRYSELIDPRLDGDVMNQEAEMLVRVALCCLHQEPLLRPTMANVVGMLQGELKLGEPNVEFLNFLTFYGGKLTGTVTIKECE